jgi:signal transduction histidine kinase
VGLAIVKRFIQKHHGQVEASGAVDGGAVFTFSLPIDPES